jgi:hypothetical protein
MAGFNLVRLVVVASVTGVFGVLRRVAGLTGDFAFSTVVQGKNVLFKRRWRPCLSGMAIVTLQPEEAGVNGRLGMTLHTGFRGVFKNFVFMAGITLDAGMFPIQYKEIGMVKIHHSIGPIVTIQAGRAKLVYMFAHKGLALCPLSMAGFTDLQVECINAVLMASLACHQAAVVILAMQRQAETSRRSVIEKLAVYTGRFPAIGRVAGGAVTVKHP